MVEDLVTEDPLARDKFLAFEGIYTSFKWVGKNTVSMSHEQKTTAELRYQTPYNV